MSPKHRLTLVCLVGLLLPTCNVGAQLSPAANSNMVTEFKGTLKSFQRGILIINRDDGTEVMVQPPESVASFNFVAEAKPGFLQRGTMVRFSGPFAANGTPQGAIAKVEVFQPVPAAKLKGSLRERYVPGIYPQNRAQRAPQPVAQYNIVGNLMGIAQSGVMMVQAGKNPVRVPLAADAKFEIRFNNLSLAQEGDAVSVAGFYQPPDDTKVRADRITITTDRVYPLPAPEPVARTKRGRAAGDDPPGEDKPAPGDGDKPAADGAAADGLGADGGPAEGEGNEDAAAEGDE